MELVSDRWYRGFGRTIASLSWLALGVCFASAFLPRFTPTAEKWGFDMLTLLTSLVTVLYVLLIHPVLLQRWGRYGTTLVITFLGVLTLTNLIGQTGQFHSWYQILWVGLVLFSGIFGNYAIMGFCFLTLLYTITLLSSPRADFSFDTINIIAIVGTFVMGIASSLIWRRLHTGQERTQIAQLSGQLSSNRQQSEALINSLGDGVILIDTDRKVTLINPTAAAMAQWDVKEAMGIDVEAVMEVALENGQPLAKEENPFSLALAHQTRIEQVLLLKRRNDKPIVASIVVTPVQSPKDKQLIGAVAVLRDVSTSRAEERKRADFISTASHEMRTPVAAIEGYLALCLNPQVSQVDPKARAYLQKAHASAQHLGELFQDLLTSAKAEDGRLVNHPAVVEIGTFMEQLADALRFAAQKKNLAVEFVMGKDNSTPLAESLKNQKVVRPLYYAYLDPERLREVLTNLFDNAVKYTETGKISLGLTGNNDVIQIFVRDTGVGIPADDIKHLFQKFYRVDTSNTRTIGGTGLGLFICRKIVEMYDGRIWVESEYGKGSTFYINLPRLSNEKAAERQKITTQASEGPQVIANVVQ